MANLITLVGKLRASSELSARGLAWIEVHSFLLSLVSLILKFCCEFAVAYSPNMAGRWQTKAAPWPASLWPATCIYRHSRVLFSFSSKIKLGSCSPANNFAVSWTYVVWNVSHFPGIKYQQSGGSDGLLTGLSALFRVLWDSKHWSERK